MQRLRNISSTLRADRGLEKASSYCPRSFPVAGHLASGPLPEGRGPSKRHTGPISFLLIPPCSTFSFC